MSTTANYIALFILGGFIGCACTLCLAALANGIDGAQELLEDDAA